MDDVTTPGEESQDTRQRLAEHVKRRRLQRGLSLRQAAETAGIARNTWTAMEDGTRRTLEASYAAIERTLHWAPGSIARIKGGGSPEELPPLNPDATVAHRPSGEPDEALIRVMRSDRLTDAQKAAIVRTLIAEQDAARRRLLKLAEQMIAEPDGPR